MLDCVSKIDNNTCVMRFIFSLCSWGHKYPSWLALPTHLNSQCLYYGFILMLLMFPLFHIFYFQSHPILLFIHPFKNQTRMWSQKRLLDCQIRSIIYQKKSIFQKVINIPLKCKCIYFMIKKDFPILLWITNFFCYCHTDSLFYVILILKWMG